MVEDASFTVRREQNVDISKFFGLCQQNGLHLWQNQGHGLYPHDLASNFKSEYQIVSVCGGFSMLGHTPLMSTI